MDLPNVSERRLPRRELKGILADCRRHGTRQHSGDGERRVGMRLELAGCGSHMAHDEPGARYDSLNLSRIVRGNGPSMIPPAVVSILEFVLPRLHFELANCADFLPRRPNISGLRGDWMASIS